MFRKYFWKPRPIKVSIIIVCVSIIIYQFVSLKSESNAVRFQQTEKFSYSLTNLAASEASRYLSQNKNKELQFLIDSLSKDPVVKDATIYDQYGQTIYQSVQAIPLTSLLNIGSHHKESEGVIPYIAELYTNNIKIGYIRITLEQQDILSKIENYQQRGLAILQVLILLAFITGMLVMALFFKKIELKYKAYKVHFPYLLQRVKTQVRGLIKKAKSIHFKNGKQ